MPRWRGDNCTVQIFHLYSAAADGESSTTRRAGGCWRTQPATSALHFPCIRYGFPTLLNESLDFRFSPMLECLWSCELGREKYFINFRSHSVCHVGSLRQLVSVFELLLPHKMAADERVFVLCVNGSRDRSGQAAPPSIGWSRWASFSRFYEKC